MNTSRRWMVVMACMTTLLAGLTTGSEGVEYEGDYIPLPPQWIKVVPPTADVPSDIADFLGGWRGKWRPGPRCYVIVTKIYPKDRKGRWPVDAIYAWGSVNIHSVWVEQPGFVFPRGSISEHGKHEDHTLTLEYNKLTLFFRFIDADQLEGRVARDFRTQFHYGTFDRVKNIQQDSGEPFGTSTGG
ncbi:MAG: hypothetical protein HY216_13320 [Candidatus Rokubacteria bacterium]|nr:hypothetical protein [Candidatus Rokubacteria bacterium]